MSLIFTESFCGNDASSKWTYNTSYIPQAVAWARSNGFVGQGTGVGTAGKLLSVSEEHATVIAGVARYRTGSPPQGRMITFLSDSGATTHITIHLNSSEVIEVYRGTTAGTLLGSSVNGGLMPGSSWIYVEAKVVLHDSAGSVEVRLDGTPIITLTGIDTRNLGTKAVIDTVEFHSGNGGAGSFYLSDIYISNGAGAKNNDFLNAPKILFLTPTGNGSSSQGVGSDSNSTDNYLLIDEAAGSAPTTVDYVDLANTGDKDLYTFSNASLDVPVVNEVYGTVGWSWAQKVDPSVRSLIHVARNGASEGDSAGAALTQGVYTAAKGVIETKPGGGAWTVTDLNAMEFGIKAGA